MIFSIIDFCLCFFFSLFSCLLNALLLFLLNSVNKYIDWRSRLLAPAHHHLLFWSNNSQPASQLNSESQTIQNSDWNPKPAQRLQCDCTGGAQTASTKASFSGLRLKGLNTCCCKTEIKKYSLENLKMLPRLTDSIWFVFYWSQIHLNLEQEVSVWLQRQMFHYFYPPCLDYKFTQVGHSHISPRTSCSFVSTCLVPNQLSANEVVFTFILPASCSSVSFTDSCVCIV